MHYFIYIWSKKFPKRIPRGMSATLQTNGFGLDLKIDKAKQSFLCVYLSWR